MIIHYIVFRPLVPPPRHFSTRCYIMSQNFKICKDEDEINHSKHCSSSMRVCKGVVIQLGLGMTYNVGVMDMFNNYVINALDRKSC